MVIYIYSQTQTPCGIPWNWKTQVVEILSASRCENIDLKMHLAGEAVAAENLCWKTGKDEDLTIKHGVFNHQTWRIWPSNMVVQLFIWPAMLCWPTKENSTQRWTLPSWTAGIMSTFFFFSHGEGSPTVCCSPCRDTSRGPRHGCYEPGSMEVNQADKSWWLENTHNYDQFQNCDSSEDMWELLLVLTMF